MKHCLVYCRFFVIALYLGLVAQTQVVNGAEEMYPCAKNRKLSPGNTTYFIDPAKGNDSNSGLKQNLAWRSFARVNHLRLAAGDHVKIVAPGSFDQTLMLMGAGTEATPVEVTFAPGRYDFYPTKALTRKYQISNTNGVPDGDKALGILLDGAKHFKVSGPGATIVYRGKMIEVAIDGCQDITISDLRFDYHRPTVSEYTVAATGDGYVDLKIHKDSHYTIDNGEITWKGEGWSYQTGLAQELDLDRNEVWRRRDPLVGLKFEEIKPFLVRAHGKQTVKPGRVYQLRDTTRDCAGVFTRRSKNITWKDVRFHFLHGMGLVNQFSENLTFDRVVIAPDKASGRTTAAWADCIQVSGCKGKLLVKDCLFSGAHDDAINIHGTHLRVVERVSDKQIKVRFIHSQTFGFLAFNPGDEIEFVRWDSLKTYGPNRVKDARLLNPKELMLTLEKPVPSEFKENDAVENVTWTPEVEIRGCTVLRIPTRGFLITTRRKVLVEDNRFVNTHMSAILLEDDARGWFESGCVRDMTIRKNKFIRCAEPVININPQNGVANDAVHQNIRIEENEFFLRNATIVRARSTKGLDITGNTVYSDQELNDELAIKTSDCSDVEIDKNRYLPLPAKGSSTKKPLKVYIMAGQSNMQGHAHIRTLGHIGMNPKTAPMLDKMCNADGTPRVFDKVWISTLGCAREEKVGKLTTGFGAERSGPKIGPELTFGIYMQEHVKEPILIIKTAWGGKSLCNDFRPPSAGPYKAGQDQPDKSDNKKAEIKKVEEMRAESTGHYYRLMMGHVKKVLADIKRVCPDYDPSQGYEVAGFMWFQGCNDFGDFTTYPNAGKPGGYDEYSRLMAHFIRDVRKELNAPKMPFVIGVLGIKGDVSDATEDEERPLIISFRKAMAAPADMPEFKGTVAAVHTEKFWDAQLAELQGRWVRVKAKSGELKSQKLGRSEQKAIMDEFLKTVYNPQEWELMEKGVSNAGYHYMGSATIMARIGKAFAEALAEMPKGKAQK